MRNIGKAPHLLVVAIVSGFFLASCASAPKIEKDTPIQDMKKAPKWVLKCSGAFEGDKNRVIYGCSSAILKNPPLKRSAANNRARNEIAKFIKVYTSSLMKDYRSEIVAGDPDASEWEMYVAEAQKTVTSATLSGIEIVDHWEHPVTGEFFSLARLDLSAFEDNVESAQQIKESVKKIIRDNAERLHQEMETQEKKVREQD